MVENQGWDGDHHQPLTCGVHQVDGINMIAIKMDLLMKKLEASSNLETVKIMDARMMCSVWCNVGHTGNNCLETREEASFILMATITGSATTTTTIKGGTRGPTSCSTIKMELIILTFSIINLPLKILSLANLELMKI
jgi:hypothetical protein